MSLDPASSPALPLSDTELEDLFDRLDVPEAGRALVRALRISEPVRRVRSTRRSSPVRYQSIRMGRTIQCESATVEFPCVLGLERDPTVYEFFDQPYRLSLRYPGKNGRTVRASHVVDLLLISESFVGFVECKDERDLKKLAQDKPGRWQSCPGGTWRSIPGEEAAAQYGLGYRVWSSASVRWTLLENIEFLVDYLDSDYPCPDDAAVQAVQSLVADQIGVSLDEVLEQLADPDLVYYTIARSHIYSDLDRDRISQTDAFRLFSDAQAARVWRAACGSLAPVPGIDADSVLDAAAMRLQGASESARATALARSKLIDDIVHGAKRCHEVKDVPRSTVARWVRAWRCAERDYGFGFLGLFPDTQRRGNRTSRLPEEVSDLAREVADEIYFTPDRPTVQTAYGSFCKRCKRAGFVASSYRTFRKALLKFDKTRSDRKRYGHKVADANAPVDYDRDLTFAIEGTRPFGVVHIDHTKLDLFLRFRIGRGRKRRIARVWLTIAYCAWSRSVLGCYLSFDAPSYVSCMGVLRDMVRNHERLPVMIVVDNAKEFDSIAFEQFCAAYRIIKRSRPKGAPRYGSACERVFGTNNTQFVHNLMGNTQALRDPRSMSREVDPRTRVVWTLDKFEQLLRRYFFDTYAGQSPSDGVESPRERLERGWRETGRRLHKRCFFDQKFFMLTLPPARRSTAKVDYSTGIQVANIRYHAVALRAMAERRVSVRIDPDDVSHVYAWVKSQWVECRSPHSARLRGYTPRQVRLASQEIRAGAGKTRSSAPTVLEIADLLDDAKNYEKVQLQLDRDAARRESRQSLDFELPCVSPQSAGSDPEPDPDSESRSTPWANLPELEEL